MNGLAWFGVFLHDKNASTTQQPRSEEDRTACSKRPRGSRRSMNFNER
jgi:hypothetical protein